MSRAWDEVVLDVWRAGQRLGAVGPGDVAVHIAHGRALAAQLDQPERAVDLGSGAGIPGLVLAGLWPTSRWLLVDAAARRVRLLSEGVARLGWGDRIEVRHGRAEDVSRDPSWSEAADLVTARSFGPPAATAECAVRFLRVGGVLVVTEPPTEDGASRWPPAAVADLGLEVVGPVPTDTVRVQRLVRTGAIPDRFPRRAGVPSRRPLF